MKVTLRNPDREVEVEGPATVAAVLARLDVHPDSVIVIRGDTLATKDERIGDDEHLELRPVVSGGSA